MQPEQRIQISPLRYDYILSPIKLRALRNSEENSMISTGSPGISPFSKIALLQTPFSPTFPDLLEEDLLVRKTLDSSQKNNRGLMENMLGSMEFSEQFSFRAPVSEINENCYKKVLFPEAEKFQLSKWDTPCCNCKKSRCLKSYCDCFVAGCSYTNCTCPECQNRESYQEERRTAINQISMRNPVAFQKHQQSETTPSLIKCNCIHSHCLKKYCECYKNGRKCGVDCNCVYCENYQVVPNIVNYSKGAKK